MTADPGPPWPAIAKALGSAPLAARGLAAAHRLDPGQPDRPLQRELVP